MPRSPSPGHWLERLLRVVTRIASMFERALRHPRHTPPATTRPPTPLEPTPAPTPVTLDDTITSLFAQRGITVVRELRGDARDPGSDDDQARIDRMVWFMGERFAMIEPLLVAIKHNIQGRTLSISLTSFETRKASDICQMATWAHTYKMLTSYQYSKETRTISACVSSTPTIINFFNGRWLERYIVQKIKHTAEQYDPPIDVCIKTNLIIELPDHTQREIDILVAIPRRIYLIEAKSGAVDGDSVQRYAELARALGIRQGHALMVRARTTVGVKHSHGIHMYPIGEFEHTLRRMFDAAAAR